MFFPGASAAAPSLSFLQLENVTWKYSVLCKRSRRRMLSILAGRETWHLACKKWIYLMCRLAPSRFKRNSFSFVTFVLFSLLAGDGFKVVTLCEGGGELPLSLSLLLILGVTQIKRWNCLFTRAFMSSGRCVFAGVEVLDGRLKEWSVENMRHFYVCTYFMTMEA